MSADFENCPRLLNPILGPGLPAAQAHPTENSQRKGRHVEAFGARARESGYTELDSRGQQGHIRQENQYSIHRASFRVSTYFQPRRTGRRVLALEDDWFGDLACVASSK